MPEISLAGKVALVTGARRGVGKAIATAFASAGADVALADLVNDAELAKNATDIKELGRRSLSIQADITRKSDVERLVRTVIQNMGTIDILVNNAGVLIRARLVDMAESDWDWLINTDLKGPFLCSQAVGKHMKERKQGCIINIASEHGLVSAVDLGAYCVAKAGVIMLTRVLARELGGYGIRANAIGPSLIKTEMTRYRWSDHEVMKKRLSEIPLGRIALPEDIAGVALFLASDTASYISGHTIVVDGGQIA